LNEDHPVNKPSSSRRTRGGFVETADTVAPIQVAIFLHCHS
jgi:hypothetical protein